MTTLFFFLMFNVRGIVVDPAARPVEGAKVVCGSDSTLTDAHGQFEFPSNDCTATVTREGFAVKTIHLDQAREASIALALAPTNRLAHGVYAVRAAVEGRRFDGVASFGTRPTVEGAGAPLLEVFLFDFSGDLYGKTIDVAFEAYLRPELKFDSLEALKARMAEDVAAARAALKA